MSGQKLTVTYCDEYEVWPLIADDLSSRLPLRHLKWQPSSQRAECIIPLLEVDLKRFTIDPTPPSLTATQTVYLNLYFVTCDDNEVYKSKIRKNIRQWVEMMQTKKNQEWLIVYVADTEAKRSNNYLGLKSSIYDKIKTDFNPPKQDRCAYIRKKDPEGPQSELWSSFIEKMKECILSSFDMQVLQIQEDTRRLDMQRHMPGWNYCTFFILKEGLAQAYEIMTLYEDALIQYDELEASFFQVLRDKALAWFGHFGGTDAYDDSGNILDFKRKNYRDLINKNIISVFDFRSYLFARQCRMLIKLQRVVEMLARAQLFITSFIPSIRENALPEHFLESWVFSACMNVVNECEPLGEDDKAYHAVKADLLLTARRQLDKLGVKWGHLPNTEPFSIYMTEDNSENNDKIAITNPKLLEAMASLEAFDKAYMGLSTRVIKCYDQSNRARAALSVHGDIAALKYVRGKDEECVRIFESMIWRYGEDGWNAIENSLLIKCADAQRRLGRIDQYVESVLALLKNSQDSETAEHYTNEMLTNVIKLDKIIKRPFEPIFEISVISIIDGISVPSTSVEVCIYNRLPKKIYYDTISLRLVGSDPEQIWFTTANQDLLPGKNTFLLTSKVSTSGNYVVEMCEMEIGKLVFSHNFLRPGQKKRVMRLNHDINQLYLSLQQPCDVCLGERQKISVQIDSRTCHVKQGVLLLEPQTEGMEIIRTNQVKGILRHNEEEQKEIELKMSETTGEITLPELYPLDQLEVFVKYDGPYTEFDYRIKSTVTYESKEDKECKFISSDYVRVTMPLLVTESTIFRENCIFLKVELACNGDLPVRILGAFAKPSTFYVVESQSEMKQCDLTLFPRQTVTFIYKLLKREDEDDIKDVNSKIYFSVKYRTLKNEVENSLQIMLKEKLKAFDLDQHTPYVFQKIKEAFLDSVDYSSYGLTDVVHLDNFDVELCESFLLNRDLKTKVQLLDLIEDFFEQNVAITMQQIKQKYHHPPIYSITFPLEVPTKKIIHTAELILSVEKDLLVSEACSCTLRIKQLTYWDPSPSESYYYYDIDVDYDNWLLSGKRRLRFLSKPGQIMDFPIKLIPLKTGNLLLPNIRVSSVSPDIFASTIYVNSAQQILVKPKSKTATFFVEQQQRFVQQQQNMYNNGLPIVIEK
ncbi:trafficking protein particle complex subunit 10 [Cokeromyces recurvatus]|uniref:trafficking protein particle complex subunit 10 n=1 Tax=Cokeromyces recurvatus TaxID=90255 RepID=UPI00221EF18A|nr:trafficking protein particle complex subunit 10 [Cokeromyces recurvatus]KAI7906306.1 trafficking protein particle complex subunit 10 [Cokeromyces recurvatus]